MQNFKSSTATVIELRFFMKKKKKRMKKKMKKMKNLRKSYLPVFHTSCDIFIQFFACSYFLHVLHLDVLRGQIEIELRVKTNISLCMAIMLDHPWQSLYRVSYR